MKNVAVIFLIIFLMSCGREESRILGKEYRQVLKVPNMSEFINVSFDKDGNTTVKNITFLATDGYVYTQEFKDISPLEGIIRWVPFGQKDDVVRSRSISRWFGSPVNLEIPEDCAKVLGVDVGFTSKNERTKNLYYLSTDGKILDKEYRDGLVDRHFEGWMEIKKE